MRRINPNIADLLARAYAQLAHIDEDEAYAALIVEEPAGPRGHPR